MSDELIERALQDIRKGKMVLIFDSDDRERETDMTVASQFVTPASIREMRKNAGGLICTTAHHDICQKLDLPFLGELPLALDVRVAGDAGTPVAATDSPLAAPYLSLADRLIAGGMG